MKAPGVPGDEQGAGGTSAGQEARPQPPSCLIHRFAQGLSGAG